MLKYIAESTANKSLIQDRKLVVMTTKTNDIYIIYVIILFSVCIISEQFGKQKQIVSPPCSYPLFL
jgi:hypothetical protein